jgi:hypothetical protein
MSDPAPPRPFPPGPLLREVEELDDRHLRVEKVLRLPAARVVFADHDLLRHDFPQLRDVEPATVDRWLLRHAAWISRPQAAQSRVNTPIATAAEHSVAYRPARYGRALVVAVADTHRRLPPDPAFAGDAAGGLLDLKGTGVAPGKVPRLDPGGHFDGLLTLERALIDWTLQEVIAAALAHAGAGFATVPSYAVLDLDFDVRGADGRTFPAAMQVRRAHRRPLDNEEVPPPGSPEDRLKLEIELLLRRYGLTSCTTAMSVEVIDEGAQGEDPVLTFERAPIPRYDREGFRAARERLAIPRGRTRFEGVNVQLAREVALDPPAAQLVDFGHYSRRAAFEHPVVTFVDGPLEFPLSWGQVVWPRDPVYAQPDPALLLPEEPWGRPDRPEDEEEVRRALPGAVHARALLAICALARRYRASEISGGEVRAALGEIVATATGRWGASSG